MLQHKLCIDSIDSSDNVDKIREVVQKLILDATILDERRAIEVRLSLFLVYGGYHNHPISVFPHFDSLFAFPWILSVRKLSLFPKLF